MFRCSHSNKFLPKKRSLSRSGMTLIEVVLALAVAGFLLTAATSFVVSISNIWAERSQRNFFEDHVDGVTEFINVMLLSAGNHIKLNDNKNSFKQQQNGAEINILGTSEIPSEQNDTYIAGRKKDPQENLRYDSNSRGLMTYETSLRNRDSTPIIWEKLPGSPNYQEPLLHFKLNYTPPLFVSESAQPSLDQVEVYLFFDSSKGLSVLWHSVLQEKTETVEDLRRTLISPYVKSLEYVYWDSSFEKWEIEKKPKEGENSTNREYLLPRAIQLSFVYENEIKMRTLTIPVTSYSTILF